MIEEVWAEIKLPTVFDAMIMNGIYYRNCWNIETAEWEWMEQTENMDPQFMVGSCVFI
ncbi:MAG: hypothetical protein V4563_18025 [Pseudomonadota bacterium]